MRVQVPCPLPIGLHLFPLKRMQYAGLLELVDNNDLESLALVACGFESRVRYHRLINIMGARLTYRYNILAIGIISI